MYVCIKYHGKTPLNNECTLKMKDRNVKWIHLRMGTSRRVNGEGEGGQRVLYILVQK
jgi:hypothetical protein